MADIAVDADVLMNLVASGEVSRVMAVAVARLVISPAVESEALYLEDEASPSRQIIDLTPLFAGGSAVRADLSQLELERFVDLAAEVDDGEAQALAVAVVRQLAVATDDRRATRVAERLGLLVIDTPQLLLGWAETVDPQIAAAALVRVERRARFIPRVGHLLRPKWDAARGSRD